MLQPVRLLTAAALAAALVVSTTSVFAGQPYLPYVKSDTSVSFTLTKGKTYTYKMAVYGTHENPHICAGNGAVMRTENVRRTTENGVDVYYFQIRAVGNPGEATGIYTTLPAQAPVRHSDVAIPYPAGTYLMGRDIPAGQYAVTPDCYLNSRADLGSLQLRSGDTDRQSILSGVYALTSRHLVTAADGQYLQIKNASMILSKDMGRLYTMGSGQYKVGLLTDICDIEPGTYRILAKDMGAMVFWELRNRDDADTSAALSNGFVQTGSTGSAVAAYQDITVKAGQYLTIDGRPSAGTPDEALVVPLNAAASVSSAA